MKMPDDDVIAEYARRIEYKDVDWFRERYHSGDMEWVHRRIGDADFTEMGRRIEMGDLGWVGTSMGALSLPGFSSAGPLMDLLRPSYQAVTTEEAPVATEAIQYAEDRESRWKKLLLIAVPLLVAIGVVAFLLTQCGEDEAKPVDLVQTASKAGERTKWAEAVEAAGLTETLRTGGPFTVFAPSDAAFDELGPETYRALLVNKGFITKVVNFHVTNGSLRRADLQSGPLATLEGSPLTLTVDGDRVIVADASPVTEDANADGEIVSTNGVLHTMDRVLVPPSVDLASLRRGAITAAADESGALTLTGKVGSEAARTALVNPFRSALPEGRVTDSLTVEADAPITGFTVNLIGRTREGPAKEVRDALASINGIGVNDQLEVVPTPKLEADINALFQKEPIQFDTGSATIRSASNSTLDKAAALLKATPQGSVQFDGHTDSAGNPAKNLELSQARAEAVKAGLVTRGIDAARMTAKGYGAERPIADNATAAGRQRNRRVEALVTGA